ncbi:hypothetical protein ACTQX2_09365 [Megamonas funiformis]|uniref:hypothetical protein n=1 Tax=Megamonas funiformis TaxID=437897 RepID=UPI003F9BC0FF
MTDDVKLENEEVKKTKIKLIPKILDTDKEFYWFDLIKCKYKINEIYYEIYLPASFLKIHEFLPKDIDIKNKENDKKDGKEYLFNFDCLKVNDKTLKEYFDTCEENKNDINFDILIKYCKPLYYLQETKDAYMRDRKQSNNVLKQEFKDFYCLFAQKELDIKNNLSKIYHWFKLFILFRCIKIGGIPEHYDKELSENESELKKIRITKFFSLETDNATIAPLDGELDNERSIYIKKFYALIWNTISEKDMYNVINTIVLVKYMEKELINLVERTLYEINNNRIIKDNNNIYVMSAKSCMNTFIKGYRDYREQNKFYKALCIKLKNLPISAICLVEIYLMNYRKKLYWRKVINDISNKMIIECDFNNFEKLRYIINNYIGKFKINENDILQDFLSNMKKEDRDWILSFLYPEDTSEKNKKKKLKRIFCIIEKAYGYYFMKKIYSNIYNIDYEDFSNISNYLYENKDLYKDDDIYNIWRKYLYDIFILIWLVYNLKLKKSDSFFVEGLKYTHSGISSKKNINKLTLKTIYNEFNKDIEEIDNAVVEVLIEVFIRYEGLLQENCSKTKLEIYDKYFALVSKIVYRELNNYLKDIRKIIRDVS